MVDRATNYLTNGKRIESSHCIFWWRHALVNITVLVTRKMITTLMCLFIRMGIDLIHSNRKLSWLQAFEDVVYEIFHVKRFNGALKMSVVYFDSRCVSKRL